MAQVDLERMYQNVTTFLHSIGMSNILFSISWDVKNKSGKNTISAVKNNNMFIFVLRYWVYEDKVSFSLFLGEQEIYRNEIEF
jgi:hypothetical protein